MVGVTIKLFTPSITYENGDRVETFAETEVENVLIAPASSSDVFSSDRPDGDKAEIQLAFPKTFTGDLRGCEVEVDNLRFRIVGEPIANMKSNCPTQWFLTARAEVVHG